MNITDIIEKILDNKDDQEIADLYLGINLPSFNQNNKTDEMLQDEKKGLTWFCKYILSKYDLDIKQNKYTLEQYFNEISNYLIRKNIMLLL